MKNNYILRRPLQGNSSKNIKFYQLKVLHYSLLSAIFNI